MLSVLAVFSPTNKMYFICSKEIRNVLLIQAVESWKRNLENFYFLFLLNNRTGFLSSSIYTINPTNLVLFTTKTYLSNFCKFYKDICNFCCLAMNPFLKISLYILFLEIIKKKITCYSALSQTVISLFQRCPGQKHCAELSVLVFSLRELTYRTNLPLLNLLNEYVFLICICKEHTVQYNRKLKTQNNFTGLNNQHQYVIN